MHKDNKTLVVYKNLLRTWKLLGKEKPSFFVVGGLSAIVGELGPYLTIWISAQIINELAGGRNIDQLLKYVCMQLTIMAVLALLSGGLTRWCNYLDSCIRYINRKIFLEKYFSLDYEDIDNIEVREKLANITNAGFYGYGFQPAINYYKRLISIVTKIVGGIVLSIGLFTQMATNSDYKFLNSPIVVVGIIISCILITWLASKFSALEEKFQRTTFAEMDESNKIYSFWKFSLTEQRHRAIDNRMYNQSTLGRQITSTDNCFGPQGVFAKNYRGKVGISLSLASALTTMLTGITYLFVCLKAWAGAFGIGSCTQYISSITKFVMGLTDLTVLITEINTNNVFLEKSFEFLDIPNKMYQGSLTTEKRNDKKYDVEFKNVSFKYPGSDKWVLKNVNIKFQIGKRLAIVGMNGSGKTTFIKLLCRLYDPTEGEILLNGINIKKYRYDEYINIFSVVFQDYKLFSLKLGENISGSKIVDKAKAHESLLDAGFDNYKSVFSEDFETYLYKNVAENGVEISGGEAQKIAIARALYKDASFLILDEPTAALDPITEASIYEKLNDIIGDKTAVYISHRLSSCKFCDEVIVFHDGTIIQQGSHEELVTDASGKYYELWTAQAQYYSDDEKIALIS